MKSCAHGRSLGVGCDVLVKRKVECFYSLLCFDSGSVGPPLSNGSEERAMLR